MSAAYESLNDVGELLTDPQTRTFSREFFDAALEREVTRAQRQKSWLSLLFLDIDRFSALNERLGREAGDQVLRAVGLALQESLRHSDVPCRYQDDQFVVLMPETGLTTARLPAERIRARVRQIQGEVSVTVSGGLAELSTSGGSAARLLEAASQGLDRARARGGDRILYCAS